MGSAGETDDLGGEQSSADAVTAFEDEDVMAGLDALHGSTRRGGAGKAKAPSQEGAFSGGDGGI